MKTSNLHCTLGVCAAIALLAGCSSANVTPSAGNALVPNSNSVRAPYTIADGLAPKRHKHREHLGASGTGQGSCYGFSVEVQGEAKGPYPGTFTGNGGAYGRFCNQGSEQIGFGGTFNITSGANTISGSFSNGKDAGGGCGRGGCGAGGKVTYKATLYPSGETFSGDGSATLHSGPGSGGWMYVTLNGL